MKNRERVSEWQKANVIDPPLSTVDENVGNLPAGLRVEHSHRLIGGPADGEPLGYRETIPRQQNRVLGCVFPRAPDDTAGDVADLHRSAAQNQRKGFAVWCDGGPNNIWETIRSRFLVRQPVSEPLFAFCNVKPAYRCRIDDQKLLGIGREA